jgi:ribonuclease BN (tRNA processing enzyme)
MADSPPSKPASAPAAAAANVKHLTLIHLDPRLTDEQALQDDPCRHMHNGKIGEDGAQLEL